MDIRKEDLKCLNRPSGNDFRLIIPDNQELQYSPDIIIKTQDHLIRIDVCHPAVYSMGYVLFFPKDDLWWSPKMKFVDSIYNILYIIYIYFLIFLTKQVKN